MCHTSPVQDGNWGIGGGVIASYCNSIHSDGVISAWLKSSDGCSGLSARDCELLRSFTA